MEILTTEELLELEEEEKKKKLGSQFGGGWGLPDLIKENQEEEFQKVYKEMATKQGLSLNPDDPLHYYDWRALFKDTGKLESDESGHFPSKYKLEGHPNMIMDNINTKTGEFVPGGGGSAGVISQEVKTITTAELLEMEKKETKEAPKSVLDVLNESIEKDYKEYLKLQKTLSEFDTTLEGVPPNIQPSIIANYNKEVNKFNSLIGGLQTDIAKRDQIISTQKQEFEKEKLATEQMSPLIQNLLSGRVPKADEADIKDISDAFVLGGSRIWQQTKDYFTSALPNIIFRDVKVEDKVSQYAGMTQSQVDKLNIGNKKKLEKYNEGYLRSQENYYKWLKDNPQLQPREEWAEGVIASVKKDPSILADPAYWAYVAADSAAFTGGIMATTLAVTSITQNPLLGMAAGVAVATPMQTQELYEDLIASGATPEQAGRLSAPVGAIIAAVEVVGDLPILASVSKPFKKLLFKNIRSVAVAKVAKYAMKTPIAKFITMEVSETVEEIVQAGLQDACVMTVDENRKFLGDLKEIVATTPMATLPFALFGVSADINTQNKVKAKVKARIDKLINDRNLRNAIKIQLEEQGIIPKEEVVTEAMKVKPKKPTREELYAEKYGIPLEKVKITKLPKGEELKEEVVSEEMIKKMETMYGKGATPKEVLKKVKEAIEPKEELKVEVKEPTEVHFDKKDTDMPFYNSLLKDPKYAKEKKGLKVSVKMISPERYLKDVSEMQGIGAEEQRRFIDDKLVDKYVENMKQGVKMPMLVIDEASKLQEGRHRAVAAKKLGIEEVPVLVVEKVKPKEPVVSEEEVSPAKPEKVEKPIPEGLKIPYLKVIAEIKSAKDRTELNKDIWFDLPITVELQNKYPDLMKKIPRARLMEEKVSIILEEDGVSLTEEGKVEAIWAGSEIGGTSEEITKGTLETFEKTSEFLYDKPFEELKKSELKKVLETSKQALPDSTGEYINKIGTPAKGLKLSPMADENAMFIFGGFEKGKLTDSHLLVLDEEVSKKILSDLIEKYRKGRIKEVQSETVSYKQAEKITDKEIEGYKKRFAKDFPETKKIVSKEDIEKATPLWILGHRIAEEYIPSMTYFTDGKIQVAIDTDKVAFLNKHFPNAEIKTTGENKPVLFIEAKDLKAVVMPVRTEGEFPFKITGEPTISKKITGKVEPVHYDKSLAKEVNEIIPISKLAEVLKKSDVFLSNNPLRIGKELESYPTEPILLARQAELIFEQHLKGKKADYPIKYGEQNLQSAINNLKENFGGKESYPEAQKAIERAELVKSQLVPEVKPTIEKPSKVKPTVTIKPKLSPEEIAERKRLIKQIHTIKSAKGLTDKEYTQIKRRIKEKYGITWIHLPKLNLEQLRDVAKSMERARPKQIGYQKVITLKTEKKIQSLKDSLIEKFQMTEEAYKEILKDLGIHKKEPRYIDGKHFITEQKGKELIYRLIDESNILKITEPLRIALEKNPEIKKLADVIDERIRLEGERTLKDPHDWNSARSYFQILETITGAPFFTLYQDLINCHLENRAGLGHLIKEFDKFKDIIKDEKKLKRVEDWILVKSNLKGKPETPTDITPQEIEMAKKIEGILKDYQARARTEKFLDNIEHLKEMPQYLEYKKEIDKAKDIYESKGYDDLVKYMETQKWGVIKSGYDPLQVVSARIRTHKAKGLTIIFGKEHIKVRKDIEYKEQDTNIITRLLAYKRQMDNLSTMSPKVRALITLANKNLDKFKNPRRVRNNLQIFFRELKGYDRLAGWFERGINRLYSQAMITIIMGSPPLSFRNLGQNFGLGHDKAMLVDPRNKKLTPDEIDYLDTYVQQAEFMRVDWFMTGEKPLPGLKFLTDIIKKVNLYPRSDIANRHWGFWGKINQVRMAFEDKTISLKKKTEKAKFSDFSLLEQKGALEILAKDGQEAMNKYVAKIYVDDVHFLYERAQRSLAEMGKYGKIFGNLMLFPRAYWEKLAKFSKKMTGKNVPYKERLRAFKVIASVLIGGALVGVAYKKVTGRKEPPYDPLILLAYEPGGLLLSSVEAMTDVYTDTIMAVRGDKRALATLTSSIPNLADHYIPFYNYMLRGYEAFLADPLANKNIDKLALKKLRQLINKEYQIRGGVHSVERNAIEKWQYFLGGAGVDVTIKERKAEAKRLIKERKGVREFSTEDIYKELKLEDVYKELEKGFDTADIYKELGL